VLDAGALGVVVPDVATPEQARAAIAACRFPPVGRRSASAGFAAFGYRPVGMDEAAPAINAATLVVCMIETQEGVQNL
jgi:staphyloferrin B biosynthesis citrate synthase